MRTCMDCQGGCPEYYSRLRSDTSPSLRFLACRGERMQGVAAATFGSCRWVGDWAVSRKSTCGQQLLPQLFREGHDREGRSNAPRSWNDGCSRAKHVGRAN
jgi:hypothetical protein